MIRVIFVTWLIAVAGSTQAAPAAQADTERWLQRYAHALQHQDAAALSTLFDDTATVAVEYSEAGETSPVITLTGAEFLQQQRALWRFADQHRYVLRRTALTPAVDGSLSLTLEMHEHHRLFGRMIGQQHRLSVRLENRDGGLRATAVKSITTSLPGQP